MLHQAQEENPDEVFGKRIREVLTNHGGVEALMTQYEMISAYYQNNYLPLLWPIHARYRATLFRLLELLQIESATQEVFTGVFYCSPGYLVRFSRWSETGL